MLIYIIKTSDERFFYLYELLNKKYHCEYGNFIKIQEKIDKLIMPPDGIDEFGYIKHTNINLEELIKNNKIFEIYTGKISPLLTRLTNLHSIKVFSFYDDENYLRNEFILKSDVIKTFIVEKLNIRFLDIKVLVVGSDPRSYLLSTLLECDLYDKSSISSDYVKDYLWSRYDVMINFSKYDLFIDKEMLIIEMNDIDNIDLSILLNSKKIYFINLLIKQYLTKTGAKILYDSLVNR